MPVALLGAEWPPATWCSNQGPVGHPPPHCPLPLSSGPIKPTNMGAPRAAALAQLPSMVAYGARARAGVGWGVGVVLIDVSW
jgi:hypothetical protein